MNTSYDINRKEIVENKLDDYINNTSRTIIQLSDNHFISIKDFKPNLSGKQIIHDMNRRTTLINTRKRLLDKLEESKKTSQTCINI